MRAYNQARYLERAINSVLEQTFNDFELIIVNDGSTDNTQAILNQYEHNDRICIVNQKNMGRGVAGNVGLELAKGDFIAFLDSDDLWERDFLLQTYNFLNTHVDVDVVYCGWATIDEDDRILTEIKISKPKDDYKSEFLYGAIFPINVALTRKKCFDQCGTFDTSITYGEDWHLWTRFAFSNFTFAPINGVFAKYRRHSLSTTQNIPVLLKEVKETVDKTYLAIKNEKLEEKQITLLFNYLYIALYCHEQDDLVRMKEIVAKCSKKASNIMMSNNTFEKFINFIPPSILNYNHVLNFKSEKKLLDTFLIKYHFFKKVVLYKYKKLKKVEFFLRKTLHRIVNIILINCGF